MKKSLPILIFFFLLAGRLHTQQLTLDDPTYQIGDRGPAGGWIFYDKGNSSGGWRYLEAAPADTEFKTHWGNASIQTGTDVGSGKDNTQRLAAELEQSGQLTAAAHRCTRLNINGFNDWFLPSRNELAWMYVNLKEKELGGFSGDWYLSSSQTSGSLWMQQFSNGEQWGGSGWRTTPYSVRAVRQF